MYDVILLNCFFQGLIKRPEILYCRKLKYYIFQFCRASALSPSLHSGLRFTGTLESSRSSKQLAVSS